jgi:ribosomal protein S14
MKQPTLIKPAKQTQVKAPKKPTQKVSSCKTCGK